jgi:hypothetical protein
MSRAGLLRNIVLRCVAAVVVVCLLTACVPGFLRKLAPESEASQAASPENTTSTAPEAPAPNVFTHLYSQAEVEALAGAVTGPDGGPSLLLSKEEFWKANFRVHFGADMPDVVTPAECSDLLGWATLIADDTPAAGSKTGSPDHPAYVVVSGDRDDMLTMTFDGISKLDKCSPVELHIDGKTATATFERASAFTDAGKTYAVIASVTPSGGATRHVLRVAGKIGTLFVQASGNLDDPGEYRAEADRLSAYVNQVVAAGQSLAEDGVLPTPAAAPGLKA